LECLTSETVKKETVLFLAEEIRRNARLLKKKTATRASVFSGSSQTFEAARRATAAAR